MELKPVKANLINPFLSVLDHALSSFMCVAILVLPGHCQKYLKSGVEMWFLTLVATRADNGPFGINTEQLGSPTPTPGDVQHWT
jgi:hypothetical protein